MRGGRFAAHFQVAPLPPRTDEPRDYDRADKRHDRQCNAVMACAKPGCRRNDLKCQSALRPGGNVIRAHWLYSANHIVRQHRPPDPLQLELTDRLDLDGVLDLHQNSRTDQDLTRLGFVTEPRGDVRYGAYSGVVEASLEADGTK